MKEDLRKTPGQFKKSVFPVLATTLFLSGCYGHLEGKSPDATATKTPTPSSSPEATKIAPFFCNADQIGIWAPDANGTPERFETDSTQANTEVVATIWIPGGITPPETEFLLQLKGRRIEIIGAGTAWRYNTAQCSDSAIDSEVQDYIERRKAQGKTTIVVTVEQLIARYPKNVKILRGDRGSN